MANSDETAIISVKPLAQGPQETQDPFLFIVYHKDMFPQGNEKMEAPRRGNGADFAPGPYRMYHGEKIPGFPQHPHRGFETITCTIEGLIDHSDSVGNAGRYGEGDLQWMTAGKGIVHGEMFPLLNQDKPNPARFFQIWINLPKKNKMCEPEFVMHWAEDVRKTVSEDGMTSVTVWAGSLLGETGLTPPKNSWAADENNQVGIFFLQLQPGASFTLRSRPNVTRNAYYVEGTGLRVNNQEVAQHSQMELNPEVETAFSNPSEIDVCEILVLEGAPIKEPVANYGPFVMNTQEEIMQAFSDYQRTQFGGWPWPEDAMVWPREKGRFALLNGDETFPPSK